jgi:hypothetical protein
MSHYYYYHHCCSKFHKRARTCNIWPFELGLFCSATLLTLLLCPPLFQATKATAYSHPWPPEE